MNAEQSNDVQITVKRDSDGAGTGVIVLNRPRAINALTTEMLSTIGRAVAEWETDETIVGIELSGEGERGYCAGADVRSLRDLLVADRIDDAIAWLDDEYATDKVLAMSGKPLTARLHGISMGGGLGLALHQGARRGGVRVASRDLVLAMPEVGIGLWPDVAVAFELAAAPGQTGLHLAMTGRSIDAASALYAGLVDVIAATESGDEIDPHAGQLAVDQEWIDECYAADSAAEVLERLEGHENEAARQTASEIRGKCPMSVAVAFEAVRRAGSMTLAEVFEQDRALARGCMREPADFIEGVRAQLVDKDRQPRWRHARIEDVDPAEVARWFEAV